MLRPALRPAVAAAALALALAPAARASNDNAALVGGPRRPIPLPILRRGAPPPGARLVYFGGRVLGNVELVMVLWGEGAYEPYVTGEGPGTLPGLLSAMSSSGYLTGLAEYDTALEAAGGGPGTGQHIGPGRFLGQLRIAPSASADTVDDATIAAELASQLGRGALPAPRADAAGRLETLYLVYLPRGKRITMGSDESCRTFCAYHGAFPWSGRSVAYAVMPDLSAGSGCDLGCGGAEPFANAAAVLSHELAEAITDPDVAAAAVPGSPLAWYDPANGEIGDLCSDQVGTATGSDGSPWPVQKLWSNRAGACVVPAAPGQAEPLVASAAPAAAPSAAAAPAASAAPTAAAPVTPVATAPIASAAPIAPASSPALAPPPSAPAPQRAAALALRPTSTPASTAAPVALLPRAQPAEPVPLPLGSGVAFAIEEENDALSALRHPTDESYTQGLRISARWALGDGEPGVLHEAGVAFGQNLYTPSDLKTTDLDVLRHDRPYAAWLYAAFLFREVEAPSVALRLGADGPESGERSTDVEVAVGVTGAPAGGPEIQSTAHALLRRASGSPTSPPAPAGWSVYQIATQPTLDISIRQQLDLVQASAHLGGFTARTGSVLGLRLSPRIRLDVGSTFDAMAAGLEVRAGFVRARALRHAGFELYGFARADGRWVGYNGLIEGPLRHDVQPLVSVQPWVADLDVGAVLRLGALEVGYGQLRRTAELKPLPPGERRIHAVGQVTIAYAPR
jgi:hypothetical protein